MAFSSPLKFIFWILICEAFFGVSSKSQDLGKYLSGNEIISKSVFDHETLNRVKREFPTLPTDSKGTKFIEVSSKIKNVVNKIEASDAIWKDFASLFRDTNENYNMFHENGNEIGDSPVRRAISESFLPIISIMSDFELNMCPLNQKVHGTLAGQRVAEVQGFIDEFQAIRAEVKKLSAHDLLAQAETMVGNGTFTDLKDVKTASDISLSTHLMELANLYLNPLVVHNITTLLRFTQDKISVQCAIADGTLTYVSKVIFSLDLLSYFADGSYKDGNVEQYNHFFELVASSYNDARKSLVGKDKVSGESFIQKISKQLQVFKSIKSKSADVVKETERLSMKIKFLEQIQSHLERVEIPMILEVPEKLTGKSDFEDNPIKTPIGQWQDGANISYAIQYRHKNMYSRIGEWMEPITVAGEANPTLRLRVHPKRFDRLVFRKFNNQKPQLAGALEDKYQTEFRDIHRDLYDAAARFDKKSVEDAEILINNGADIDAVFEGGRRAIHAAAQSDNVDIARKFFIKPINNTEDDMNCGVNAKDNEGYTPLHVASEGGHRRFIKLLLENGGEVNAKTHLKQWTPLHIAADRGFVSTVKTLLKSKAIDVNAQERGGFSPVHRAVGGGIPVLEVLMADNRTNVQAKTTMEISPLILAIIEEYDDITNALLANKKVDINSKTNKNMTALAFASILGNTEIIQSLLKNVNVDVNVETIHKWTPLHLAVALKNDEAAKTLLFINQTIVDASTTNKITPLHIAVVTEQKDIVANLIKRGAKVDQQTMSGLAPIHLALLYKNYEIFNILVDGGADIQAKSFDGSSLLHFAINNNKFDVIESMVRKGVDMNAKNIITGETPIHTAARLGYLEVIKILVQHRADVNVRNKQGETPLHYVASSPTDRVDILDLLIGNGAHVNITDNLGRTPLHSALLFDNTNIIENLIVNGAKVNAKDNLGRTPLHMAAERDYDTTNSLLVHNADVHATDNAGQTPLHIAVNSGNKNIVRVLISKGASLKIADHNFQTPVHLAVVSHEHYILNLMKEQVLGDFRTTIIFSYETYPFLNTPLHLAIVLGHLTMIKNMMSIIDWDSERQPLFVSLLDTAAASGKLDVFEYLIGRYSLEIQKLLSPLCLAARYGHSDIVERILRADVDVNGYNNENNNLPVCCVQKDPHVMELLLGEGANVNVKCPDDLTPIQRAARSGNTEVVKLLIKHMYHDVGNQMLLQTLVQNGNMKEARNLIDSGVMVNERKLDGITLLHIMSQSGNLTEVKRLVDDGASVSSTNHKLETPLHFAAIGGNKDIIRYLASNNADVNAQDSTGRTPLHWALDSKTVDVSVVKSLFEHGAQPNLTCLRGKTPLHIAAQGPGSLEVIRYLLNKNADVNARDYEGNTPLFDAVRSGNLDIIKSLVEGGANVRILNNYKASPLHYLTSIQNGAFPSSKDLYVSNSQIFKHVSQPAMDIVHYLKSEGAII